MPRTIESELALVTSGERWQDGAKINNSITGYPAALRALADIEHSTEFQSSTLALIIGKRIKQFLTELNDESACCRIRELDAQVAALRAENETLRDTMRELVDVDDCWYDHHALCQAHSLHERPCPHQRAKDLLSVEVR